ncbi:MAG: 4-hydroxythreonine-4-phosphate dehydrogenase PdxA [Burkholderiales bacterium]|nr:4-hydroxythreonine-4-phosphate dehydrogenase PdxA [Burkholderiales bacterium]
MSASATTGSAQAAAGAGTRGRPRIAFLLGDVGGVGPEMGVKLLADATARAAVEVLLIADPVVLAEGERVAGVKLLVQRVASAEAPGPADGRIAWLADDVLRGAVPPLAESSTEAGRAALHAITQASTAARQGHVQGIVFAPLNKHSLRMAGMTHEDELRYMQELLAVRGFVCEFNITGELWTSRVTSHVPLREVAPLITGPAVREAVLIIHRALRQAGVARPRIAVTGLNPHAGDGGSIGTEEIEVIEPAVRALQAEGLDARGPYSPDTVFIAARRGDFDAVVSMYHDQGQIAMKLLGFERGVTLHGGLPVPVTTPASGSAFDIAGKGLARIDGLRAAFELNVRMAGHAGLARP